MKALQYAWARLRPLVPRTPYEWVRLLLLIWAVGLAVAAVQLDSWQRELTRTLMQLNADAQFRVRIAQRETVDPEWYRRKALSLLSATERLQHDASWTIFVPGSWRVVDDLEEQVQARLAREFGDIVVETIRRELYARTSQLTGVPLLRGGADLRIDGQCESPIPQTVERKLTAAEELPEFLAVAQYVQSVEKLDAAVQDFLSLQYASGQPEQLRRLVAYALGTELPGTLAQSAVLFHGREEVSLQPALMQSRLQWATRCALGKAVSALHTRLLNTNDLFALEQGLAERSAGLFDASARPVAFDRTLERYRAVRTLLDNQQALLAQGRNGWMRQATLQIPGYQELLARIGRTRLLGPEVVQQLENQSGAAFAEFRRQFESAFGSQGDPGIVWLEQEQRFGLSPNRAGLREGLTQLLKLPFMTEDGEAAATPKRGDPTLSMVVEDARTLADARTRFLAEHLKTFPDYAQPVVGRVVDARVSELIYQKAFRALKAALPAEVSTPIDPASFRQQREHVLALQTLLRDSGGAGLGERLVATMDAEVLNRLALLQDDWRQQPLNNARSVDFSWWRGEAIPVAQMIGAHDSASLPAAVQRLAGRLEVQAQQAKSLIALGSPALAANPSAQQWLRLEAEVERYRGRPADSSLQTLERYLAGLGELRRDNCAEKLAGLLPSPKHDDEIAVRHMQIHSALASRCNELRLQAATSSATSGSTP